MPGHKFAALILATLIFALSSSSSLAQSPESTAQELQGQSLQDVQDLIESFKLLHNNRQWKHPGSLEVVPTEESVLAKLRSYGEPCMFYCLQSLEHTQRDGANRRSVSVLSSGSEIRKKKNPREDELALVPIVQSFDKQAFQPVLNALKEGKLELRIAAWILTGMKSLSYTDLMPLLDSENKEDRLNGLNIMSSLHGKKGASPEAAVQKVVLLLESDPDEKVRLRACQTLLYYGKTEFAYKTLFKNVRSNGIDSVRNNCLEELCRSGSSPKEELFSLLCDRARNDSSSMLRRTAISNLGLVKDKSAACLPIFISAIKQEDTAWSAFQCLKTYGPEASVAIPELLKMVESKADSQLAGEVFEFINSMAPRNSAAVPDALRNLHLLVERERAIEQMFHGPPRNFCGTGPRPYDRGNELNALIGIIAANPKLSRTAIPDLQALLNNYRESVKESAKTALGKISS